MAEPNHRTGWHTRLAYAAPAFSLAVVGIPVYVYIPKFYTDVIGVPIGTMGVMLLGLRVMDAVTDPLIGVLSDRTRTRMGRRRPWMLFGAPVLAASIVGLFSPPMLDPAGAAVWFGVTVFALFLSWTVITIPYEALGPEITPDYDERTTLLGMRDLFLIIGTLAAAASPALIGLAMDTDTPAGQRRQFAVMALAFAPLVIAGTAWCIAVIRERTDDSGVGHALSWSALKEMAANRPFVILLTSFTLSSFGANLPATLILYYVEYVLESPRADLFLAEYFVVGIVFLPGWLWIARKTSKKGAWIAAMGISIVSFTGVFFLGAGDEAAYGVLVFLSGIGFGATIALPSAMQADVIDCHELATGQRREGQYVGVWAVAKKLAAALGVGIAFVVMGGVGYEPNRPQTPELVFWLRVLYALVPVAASSLALLAALAYPISRRRHRAIRRAMAAKRR